MTALECRGITKRFGEALVLEGVDLSVASGEIHVLLGENGAGKSTLMKIAAGVLAPDSGEVSVRGDRLSSASVPVAQAAGVHLIHQEPRLFPDLDVVDNMLLGAMPRRWRGLTIDRRRAERMCSQELARLGARISPHSKVRDLSVSDQQLVDMAAALLRRPSVLIVDEPTASLTLTEVERLFAILRSLKARGVAIVFIGHRLEEIFSISDRITVLRDGEVVARLLTAETSPDECVRLMVGRSVNAHAHAGRPARGQVELSIEDLASPGAFEDVSLAVHAGEILALAGLVGAGRTEIAECAFGVRPRSAGTVCIGPKGSSIGKPVEAVRAGLAYVPEDRGRHGLALRRTIRENATIAALPQLTRRGWLQPARERPIARNIVETLGVMARTTEQPAGELSGGNQQKVSLAKWMLTRPKVLIVDEPTRGVDVGAKAEIHRLLDELARSGVAVLLISSEMTEILALADRILVVREGRLVGELSRSQATEDAILRLAAGVPTAAAVAG